MKSNILKHFSVILFVAMLIFARPVLAVERPDTDHPNIIYILTDDLGYGDVHALNPERGKIPSGPRTG